MVVTKLMWTSLDLFEKSHRYMWTNPIEWNSTRGKFRHNKLSAALLPWLGSILSIILSGGAPTLILLCSQLFGYINLPLRELIISVVITVLSWFGVIVEILLLTLGTTLVSPINFLIDLERKLTSEYAIPTGRLDVLGIVLNISVVAFAIYPVTFIFFLYTDLDPLYLFGKYVVNKGPPCFFILTTIARPFVVLPFLQICRLFSILFSGLTVGCHLILSNISWMERTSRVGPLLARVLRNHAILQIILQSIENAVSALIAIIMLAGFLLSILFNFTTIKMYHVIPMPLYLFFPAVGILIPMIIQVMLPMLIEVYEGEVLLHRRWRCALWLRHGNIKYLKRRLTGVKVLRMYAGIKCHLFYFVKKSTKATYYYAIWSYTISAMLSIRVVGAG
ncbi:hypothetical protein Fcan01_27329 [Folsomia candida]|uniref:Uncharacterized protein n=1 Tax=Folsomia candida TaxID=158441 RepID=A0A226CZ38_FOLCA|nr:hypothetical protein Fcan01_27329 [Folsomia candida]